MTAALGCRRVRYPRRRRHHAFAHRAEEYDERAVPERAGRQDAPRGLKGRGSREVGGRLVLRLSAWRRARGARRRRRGGRGRAADPSRARRRPLTRAIAKRLNAESIRGPGGGTWGPSTIHGHHPRHRSPQQRAVRRAPGLGPPALREGSRHAAPRFAAEAARAVDADGRSRAICA